MLFRDVAAIGAGGGGSGSPSQLEVSETGPTAS